MVNAEEMALAVLYNHYNSISACAAAAGSNSSNSCSSSDGRASSTIANKTKAIGSAAGAVAA